MDKSVPEIRFDPSVSMDLVLVSVPALADAFFSGIDQLLVDVFADKKKRPIADQRLQKLVQATPLTEK